MHRTLHSKIAHKIPAVRLREGKTQGAPETRGFEKGPTYDSTSWAFPNHLQISIFNFEKIYGHMAMALIKRIE